jgi:hypothetical protein
MATIRKLLLFTYVVTTTFLPFSFPPRGPSISILTLAVRRCLSLHVAVVAALSKISTIVSSLGLRGREHTPNGRKHGLRRLAIVNVCRCFSLTGGTFIPLSSLVLIANHAWDSSSFLFHPGRSRHVIGRRRRRRGTIIARHHGGNGDFFFRRELGLCVRATQKVQVRQIGGSASNAALSILF